MPGFLPLFFLSPLTSLISLSFYLIPSILLSVFSSFPSLSYLPLSPSRYFSPPPLSIIPSLSVSHSIHLCGSLSHFLTLFSPLSRKIYNRQLVRYIVDGWTGIEDSWTVIK